MNPEERRRLFRRWLALGRDVDELAWIFQNQESIEVNRYLEDWDIQANYVFDKFSKLLKETKTILKEREYD